MNSSTVQTGENSRAWLGSLAAWIILLVAVGAFATATLVPRFLTYLELREQWRQDQERLVQLERQIARMNAVALSLEDDPEFTEALARVEFEGAGLPGEQRIEVPAGLTLEIRPSDPQLSAPPPAFPWHLQMLKGFVEDPQRNNGLLLFSALCAAVAFIPWTHLWQTAPWQGITAQLRERYKPDP